MITFRFIRTGPKPFNEGYCLPHQIRACFEPCTDEVKQQVEKFLDGTEESISFEFQDSKVTIRRENE